MFIFKFVWLLNQERGKGKPHRDARGFLDPDYRKWSPRDAPRIAYTFPLKQAHIYCLEMGNNSSKYETTLNSSRYETTLKTKRKLQIVSKFLIVNSKKEVGIKVYKLNEFRPSTRTKINLRS